VKPVDDRLVLLAVALSPRSAAKALEQLPDHQRPEALEKLARARRLNRAQWRKTLAQALGADRGRRERVLAAAGPLAPAVRERLAARRADAEPATDLRELLLRRLVRECGG
jgi:hypothetical protein